jgi:hypothetical protein
MPNTPSTMPDANATMKKKSQTVIINPLDFRIDHSRPRVVGTEAVTQDPLGQLN